VGTSYVVLRIGTYTCGLCPVYFFKFLVLFHDPTFFIKAACQQTMVRVPIAVRLTHFEKPWARRVSDVSWLVKAFGGAH
jgi:hypothetical protein